MLRRELFALLAGAGGYAASAQAQSFFPSFPNIGVKADTGPARSESGVGALMPWADMLWAVTYVSHKRTTGTGTGLYAIDERLQMTQKHVSSGTYANRMIHHESNQCFIGPYVIDMAGNVRVIEALLDNRLTATMRHLKDPANLVYMLDMEGLLFEMDVRTLKPTRLFDLNSEFKIQQQPHFKGAFTSQNRVIVANNTYTEWGQSQGQLAEWDGSRWNVLSQKPHMEVAGRYNMGNAVFATGWDELSVLFHVLVDGEWKLYRLPKASHTFDQFWQTEWTRIREVETERFLMDTHGMFYELSPAIFNRSVWGIRPICTHLRVVPDFCSFRGLFVMGGNEATPNEDVNPVVGQPQSGIWFGQTDDLWRMGKPAGWGGVWRNSPVKAGDRSDPFLMTGFQRKVLHLITDRPGARVAIEIDPTGTGEWAQYDEVLLRKSYAAVSFPEGFSAHWVRLLSGSAQNVTAEFIYT